MKELLIVAFALIYIFYIIYVLTKLVKTKLFSKKQKRNLGILLFILPFIIGPFISFSLKPDFTNEELRKGRQKPMQNQSPSEHVHGVSRYSDTDSSSFHH